MKKLHCLAIGIIAFVWLQSCQEKLAKNYNKIWVDDAGLSFIKKGVEGGMTEIKASHLARANSKNKRVVNLAKMIIDDHTKTDERLSRIAVDKLVNETDTITQVHEKMIADLAKKTGGDFDKAYLRMMISDHEAAITLFTAATQNADPDINKLAGKTLPDLKRHEDAANAILSSLQ